MLLRNLNVVEALNFKNINVSLLSQGGGVL